MSEAAIFGVGSIMFTMTAWATLVFGMRRIRQVQLRDLASSGRIAQTQAAGLTELHMKIPTSATPSVASDLDRP